MTGLLSGRSTKKKGPLFPAPSPPSRCVSGGSRTPEPRRPTDRLRSPSGVGTVGAADVQKRPPLLSGRSSDGVDREDESIVSHRCRARSDNGGNQFRVSCGLRSVARWWCRLALWGAWTARLFDHFDPRGVCGGFRSDRFVSLGAFLIRLFCLFFFDGSLVPSDGVVGRKQKKKKRKKVSVECCFRLVAWIFTFSADRWIVSRRKGHGD